MTTIEKISLICHHVLNNAKDKSQAIDDVRKVVANQSADVVAKIIEEIDVDNKLSPDLI